jgi:hypothetical protein
MADTGIDPDVINKMMAQAVLQSTLGDVVRQRCAAFVGDWQFKNTVDKAIREVLYSELTRLLGSTEYASQIREKVRAALSDDLVDDICKAAFAAWQKAADDMDR